MTSDLSKNSSLEVETAFDDEDVFVFPASFAQQRLWFIDQWVPNSSLYNLPALLRLQGSLNVAALEQSFYEILQRHESLRTTFGTLEGQLMQLISPEAAWKLSVIDLQSLASEPQQAEVQRLIGQEIQQPFDLKQGPLVRTTLLQLAPTEHLLLITMHHIVADLWSFNVLFQELGALYEAFVQGQPSPLPPLAIQYADFAEWQQQWLQGEVRTQLLNYWQEQLQGDLPVLQLPSDRPRPSVQQFHGAIFPFEIRDRLLTSLKALTQQEGATLFMTLLAAFQLLLHRYSGQTDILVGSPIANRNRAEIEGLIGFFVNTLVLRTDLSGDPGFRELLGRVRQVTLNAYDHQDLPFEQLVDALQPERNLSYHPLFQVMFVYQNAALPALDSQINVNLLPVDTGTAKFDLTLTLEELPDAVSCCFEYNTDLFDAATIERMAGHLQTLLESMVTHPDQPLSQLAILPEAERQQLLARSSQAIATVPGVCLHQWFADQVTKTPEAIAVSFEQTHLTYAELNQRANQLAHHLQDLGVKPDVLVGLCVDRSLEMVVGILAILKAGGAYVPLDPTYPSERLAFMLQDAQVPVLLTQESLLAVLPEHTAQTVCLDRDWELVRQHSSESPVSATTPDHLAYVIYTSGSTGKPKGVLINHANVVRLFTSTHDWFQFSDRDVWTFFHSYAFDFSVWELWGALLYGGRVVIVPYLVSRSPDAFYELLCAEGVTVLNQTPSAFRQLIRAEETVGVSPQLALRWVIFGGEALELQSLKPWFERHGDRQPQLVNMYGITETTVHVTYRPITLADLNGAPGSVIGQPIPDLQLYVLDPHLQPVPIGVPGEMYVGGAGLARGYLNRPELTAEKFIAPSLLTPHPSPLSPHPSRLYKTGDLARSLSNGDIEYLGRIDHQVKVRGFRIELGEIEAALSQHPDVREAIVLVREDTPGDKRLVAYLVSALIPDRVPLQITCQVQAEGDRLFSIRTEDLSVNGIGLTGIPATWEVGQSLRLNLQLPGTSEACGLTGQIAWKQGQKVGVKLNLTPTEQTLVEQSVEHLLATQGFLKVLQRTITSNLRNFLKQKLPDYMVPDYFVMLRAVPLTNNGKVNRRALPVPSHVRPDGERVLVAPRTALEAQMVQLWAKVLRVEQLGVTDNFFELGGNSLLATQLIAMVREALQVQLPIRCLFEQPTVAGLVKAIAALQKSGSSAQPTHVDLRTEAVLAPEIVPTGTPADRQLQDPQHILLTGATGFIGAFLLAELLHKTQADIYCLVRAANPSEGFNKLQRNLEKYWLWDASFQARIMPLPGDLAQPYLGLTADQFAQLANQLDSIYHSGADVNFLKPYSVLKAANVLGTQEVLRLACQGKVKPVHYISTVAVFGTDPNLQKMVCFQEEDDLSQGVGYLEMGYSQSKWVAENLVWAAQSRGLPVTVFRAGAIAGHSQTGVTNIRDFESSFLKGCVQMGYFPNPGLEEQNLVPVDYASQAIVQLSQQSTALGKAFHLVNPQPIAMREFFAWLITRGYPLQQLPYFQWQRQLLEAAKADANHALAPFVSLYAEDTDPEAPLSDTYSPRPRFDCRNILEGLAGTSVHCPPVDIKLLDTYLSYFVRSGYLQPPILHEIY